MAKTHNLVIKVGEYEKNGEMKNRYQNVGALMNGQHGQYILLEKTFNPAGIQDGKSSVLISIFPVRESSGNAPEDDFPF